MKVRDVMTTPVDSIGSSETIAYVARKMAEDDVGALPVLAENKLVGIVTDRDIVVRGVAARLSANEPITKVMSEDVATCGPDDDIESVLAFMSREQIRRMPVRNDRAEVIGMVTLADMAEHDPNKKEVAETLADICEPSGLHCQPPVFV